MIKIDAKIKLQFEAQSLRHFIDTLRSDGSMITVKVLPRGSIQIKATVPKKKGQIKKRKRRREPDIEASLLPQLFNLK